MLTKLGCSKFYLCIDYTSFTLSLACTRILITLDRNEIWTMDLYHSTAFIEAAKSLVPSNIKGHGKVLYQKPRLKPRLKSMAGGVYPHCAKCTVSTQREWSISWIAVSFPIPYCMCVHLVIEHRTLYRPYSFNLCMCRYLAQTHM